MSFARMRIDAATFPWTLQRYIFREMGMTFLLTAGVLTAALALGGGVLQMVELKQATPGQLLRLMALVLPIAGALTLPIAALFSAAATYGRLSADNEFIACRGGGINLHVLLLPALLLSLVSAAVTFVFMSFIIPRMVRDLTEIVSANAPTWIEQRLNRPQGLKIENYRIYADRVSSDPKGAVLLDGVAFIETQAGGWVRYGTARQIHLRFDRQDDRIRVAGAMLDLTLFDRSQDQFSQVGRQEIAAPELQPLFRHEIKFLNLWELFYYWRFPQSWPPVHDAVERLRSAVAREAIHQGLLAAWTGDQSITLADADRHYVITGRQAVLLPSDGGIEIVDAAIDEKRPGGSKRYQAGRVILEAIRARSLGEGGIRIEAYDLRVSEGQRTLDRASEVIGPVPVPPALLERVAALTPDELLAAAAGDENETVRKRHGEASLWLGGTTRRIIATLNERTAYTLSVLVLVVLAAGLGTVFRGTHAAVAFGISFVPSLFVIILIVTGKQMAQNAGTHLLGLAVMWLGIVAVAGLDGYTLTRWVRR